MRKLVTASLVLLAACALVAMPAFAQSGAAGASRGGGGFSVTIQCNVAGAEVTVDGKTVGRSPFTVTLTAGEHTVAATASGFLPYNGKFSVSQATTIPITLQPAMVSVTFSANVGGADITVNGVNVKASASGKSPFTAQLLPGLYVVTAQASGYKPLSTQSTVTADARQTFSMSLEQIRIDMTLSCNVGGADVSVSGPASASGKAPLAAQLPPGQYTVSMAAAGYKSNSAQMTVGTTPQKQAFSMSLEQIRIDMTLSCNVAGAAVSVSGPASASGRAPLAAQLPPGQYTVTMSAAGYKTKSAQMTVGTAPQKQSFSTTLEPDNATMNIVIPRTMLDPDSKDESLLRSMVKIFLDGRLMNAKAEVLGSIPVAPGKHVIRIASGSLSFQQELEFAAGAAYNLELVFGLQLKPVK